MSFAVHNGSVRPVEVVVAGNVHFLQRRFLRLPDGLAAPSDRMFVAAMFVGLVLAMTLAASVVALGMLWYASGGASGAIVRRIAARQAGRNSRQSCAAPAA